MTRAERDEGWLGSDRTQIRLSYGKEIKFKRQKGTGKMIPYFDEGAYRQKDFHVWDNEVDNTNEQSGKAWRDQADPLRDFYFLDDKETDTFLSNLGGGGHRFQILRRPRPHLHRGRADCYQGIPKIRV